MTEKGFNRRQFLKKAASVSFVTLIGVGCSRRIFSVNRRQGSCPKGIVNDPWPGECSEYIDEDGNGFCDYSETKQISSETVNLENEDQEEITLDNLSLENNSDSSGNSTQIKCNRGCSFPGHCQRFTDSDGSGYCDLSESSEDELVNNDDKSNKKGSRISPGNHF